MIRPTLASFMLIALSACASDYPPGPDAHALATLIAAARPGVAPKIRAVRCGFIAEEGTEWRRRYHERASDGRWVRLETYVAIDGRGWRLIDDVGDPDHPPDRR